MSCFLSRFKISARVCFGYAVLGALLITVCFVGFFAFERVHESYMSVNAGIDSIRRLAVLENDLSHVNNAVLFYVRQNRDEDARAVTDAFSVLEKGTQELLPQLQRTNAGAGAEKFLLDVKEYQKEVEEIFSLSEKQIFLSEKVRRQGELASEKLAAMIDESTLPSATFALTNLQERLDSLLAAALKNTANLTQYTADVQSETDGLKKTSASVKQAEMVNLKQLKGVLNAIDALESELRKYVKSAETLEQTRQKVLTTAKKNTQTLKELTETLSLSSAELLYRAESRKLVWQKGFIIFAATAGFLTLLSVFFALWGIRYPFNRLIGDIWEFARGEPKSSIPFTDRNDEIGMLAQSLAALLEAWKNPLVFSASAKNYMPLGAATDDAAAVADENENDSDGFVVLGDAVEDPETQLRQMLMFFQHLQMSASEMSAGLKENFKAYEDHALEIKQIVNALKQNVSAFAPVLENARQCSDFSALLERLGNAFAKSSDFMMHFCETQESACENTMMLTEQMKDFAKGLFQWIRMMTDVSNAVHKTSLQTKILVLNASIEALKLGGKAKACNDIISDIRQLSQQTAASVAQLQENLCSLQEQSRAFTDVLESAYNEAAGMKNALPQAAQICAEQHQDSHELSEKARDAAAVFEESFAALLPLMAQTAELAGNIDASLPKMENDTENMQAHVNAFVAELPIIEGPAA